ncbi:1-phosphofructokinase family hexose kinase [Streptomyces sp. A0592]|uniref:1-phosphofructokinase family hexose kinase n=1 Tax=Streptomyces sp. A0592 TaxID=2563099 RepID=UPI00109EAADF|nr:1-phosphofructokinase family hexose kinase [Streptomyces sp. A0592]THA85558.1 1-phosphofructokinase family hexose kinase [Streptomyces sp. A0592]
MILTVTPNPSLDRTYELPSLDRGRVLRAAGDRTDPGGKGVGVSRAAAAAGVPTTAVLPLGGAPGVLLAELLGGQGVNVTAVSIAGQTRSNISLAEPDGTLTKIHATGPELSRQESDLLLDTVRTSRAGASWVAGCGSLPGGLPPDWYADLVAAARTAGVRVALDASGPALRAALPAGPDVIKSDTSQLAASVGRPVSTLGEAVGAAQELLALGAGAVLASLGRNGLLLVSEQGVCHGAAEPAGAARAAAGAGDAALAGFLIAGGDGPGALRSAVAHGAAAGRLPGSVMPAPSDLRPDQVRITRDLPLDLPLTDPGTP